MGGWRKLVRTVAVAAVISGPFVPVTKAGPPGPVVFPDYAISELSTLGGETSAAFAINDAGVVVGSADDAQGRGRAVLWEGETPVDLGTLGGDDAMAVSISEAGQVVGGSTTVPGGELFAVTTHAFLWEDGRMTDLGTLGGEVSHALDVSASGQVVGASTTEQGQELQGAGTRAFLWEDGQMVDLGTLGGDRSWAFAITEAGEVLGAAATASGDVHAFRWAKGRLTDLGALAGRATEVVAVNAAGQAVGYWDTTDGESRAALWDGETATDLGLFGGEFARALDINDEGWVVGIVEGETDNGQRWGTSFLWTAGEGHQLWELLPEDTEWGLHGANGINNVGQIVGYGNLGEATRAFIMTPATGVATMTAEVPDLDVAEVVARAKRAVRQAATYRYETFPLGRTDGVPIEIGEVDVDGSIKVQSGDGSRLEYYDGRTLYSQRPDGTWLVRTPASDRSERLLDFLEIPATAWNLVGTEVVNRRPAYVIAQASDELGPVASTFTLWIDAATFLPIKHVSEFTMGEDKFGNEAIYADFGAPVDVRPPAAALAPTPTSVPLPETVGGSVEIVSRDIYFEPNAVTIPANTDVTIVLPNEGEAPHNFSIDALGVDVDIDWGTTEHVVVNVPPGTYEFYCAVPGHRQVGMVGTLTVLP